MWSDEWQEAGFCKFCGFLVSLHISGSSWSIMMLMTKRFLIIYSPLNVHYNMKKASLLFHSYWAFPLSLSVLQVLWIDSDNIICLHLSSDIDNVHGFIVMVIRMVIDTIALLITCVLSLLAVDFIKKSADNAGRNLSTRDLKTAMTTVLVIILNLVSWLLVSSYLLLRIISVPVPSDVLIWITFTAIPCNALINPIIYTICTRACLAMLACKSK